MGLSPSPTRRVVALVPVVVAVALAGCGGGGDASTTAGDTAAAQSGAGAQTVQIKGFAYAPADLTVAKGTTVEFPNEDGSPHTATSEDSGAFDSGTIEPGKSGEVTLDESGTFAYYCQFHPFMKGTIVVE